MAITNPIRYTSRTFNTALNDINADSNLRDKPDWFKRLIAGTVDVLSMWNNAAVNNMFLRTAYTRQQVQDLLSLIDYQLSPQTTASGTILFYIKNTATFPFSISVSDLVALTQGSLAVSAKRYEGRSSVSVTETTEAILFSSVTVATDILTVTREYTTGEKVLIESTDPPVGLVDSTSYYVIKVSATEIKLATTLANAYAGTQIDITAQGTTNVTIRLRSVQVTCYQQESVDSAIVGESDGSTAFQEFDLPDIDILKDTLTVTINSVTYTRVDNFIDSISSDKHFRILYNTDNSSKIQFGDGTYGMIPPAYSVLASYAFGGRETSNVSVVGRISIYGGTATEIEGVSNPDAISGGASPESIESGKNLGPILLKSRDRFVTSEDGQALAEAFGGLSQVQTVRNAFGVLSIKIIGIANGGGNPDSPTKTALQQYLIDRTILESVDVRVLDTTITSVNVTSAANISSGYTYAVVEPYFELAWNLVLSEAGKEIYDLYNESGIADAITLINTIFSTAFGTGDNEQISKLIENLEYRIIGADVQESTVLGYIDTFVDGIEYLTISAPAFPIVTAEDEITTPGVLTLSEIP